MPARGAAWPRRMALGAVLGTVAGAVVAEEAAPAPLGIGTVALSDGSSPAPPTGTGLQVAYLAVLVAIAAVCLAALLWRYRRLAGR